MTLTNSSKRMRPTLVTLSLFIILAAQMLNKESEDSLSFSKLSAIVLYPEPHLI
jgi:hypothetical protein